MKITAKEILADKGNIYKNMTKEQLHNTISEKMSDNDFFHLADLIKCDNVKQCVHKLWVKWHYRDGRPKPIRVRHRCERKELDKANKNLEAAMCDVIDSKKEILSLRTEKNKLLEEHLAYLERIRNYQSETSQKNIQIINLQGELSKAHNTTKIVAFVSLVIILGLILIPYFY